MISKKKKGYKLNLSVNKIFWGGGVLNNIIK